MDRIKALEVFVKVVDTNSFSKAAEQIQLPRSTVSSVISQLERDLGVRLLNRTTRKVSPTPDGLALLERARQMLLEIDEIDALFQHDAQKVSGRLKIDVPSRIASRIIAPALPEFFERYPNLELVIGATDRTIDLVQEGADCVIRVGVSASSSLIARPLGKFDLINCASPGYFEKFGIPILPNDLNHHWAINYASATTGRIAMWEYKDGDETKNIAMKSRVTVNQAENYIACAVAGLGLIQVPAYDVKHHILAGELQEVLPNWRAPSMPVTALYPHRRHLSNRVRFFIDWMSELIRAI
ncbi:LysR family transcriptional regulator [Undibacterium sp. Ji67W]|uniref:LysR family transcriptional regulator n=1 Tax=Undibacterium sp. Ji67W TaxID=3413042 RepID=UPI003BF452C7